MKIKWVFGIGLLTLLSLIVLPVTAEKYRYFQNFEDYENPFMRGGITNGKHTINFEGITDEKAFSGKKSYKLDVTIEESEKKGMTYHIWNMSKGPAIIPAEGRLKLSARIWVDGATSTARGGLVARIYVPKNRGTTGSIKRYYKSTDGWELLEMDLVAGARELAAGKLAKNVYGASVDDVGKFIHSIYIYVCGRPGNRFTIYIDDIKIEGDIPDKAVYNEECRKRWLKVKDFYAKTLKEIEAKLGEMDAEAAKITEPAEREEAEKNIKIIRKITAEIKKRGWGSAEDFNRMNSAFKSLEGIMPSSVLM